MNYWGPVRSRLLARRAAAQVAASRAPRSRRSRRAGGIETPRRTLELLEARCLLSVTSIPELTFYQPPTTTLAGSDGFLSAPALAAPLDIALAYLRANAGKLGLTPDDVADPFVTNLYTDSDTGVTHIYLRQVFNGLEIVNAALNMNISRLGEVLNVGSSFVDAPDSPTALEPPGGESFMLPAEGAIARVSEALGLTATAELVSMSQTAQASDALSAFAAPGVSQDPIPAKQVYVATPQGLQLSWELVIRTPDGAHWYDLMADAATGAVLQGNDWSDSDATYNVFPYPSDSPSSVSRTILTDPHDVTASPYGWHDTNGVSGAEFTDTRGNNVFAQEDADGNNTGGVRPDGGAGLSFDAPIDFNLDPTTYTNAATINLFCHWLPLSELSAGGDGLLALFSSYSLYGHDTRRS